MTKKELKELEKYKELENKIGCSIHELFAQNVFDSEQIGLAIVENLVKKIKEQRKELKALEIIKNCLIGEYELIDNAPLDKVFNSPYRFRVWADYMHCNEWIISKEEYNLLKEVLKEDKNHE